MFKAYKQAFTRWKDPYGLAGRNEYWSFQLINVIIYVLYSFLGTLLVTAVPVLYVPFIVILYAWLIVIAIVDYTLTARRFNDIGRHFLWSFVPLYNIYLAFQAHGKYGCIIEKYKQAILKK